MDCERPSVNVANDLPFPRCCLTVGPGSLSWFRPPSMPRKQFFGSALTSYVNLTVVSCHQGMVLSDIPPQNWVKGGWAERKMMVVKEGFLTLLYLTLDVKNATWIWNHICDQGKREFWISVLNAQVLNKRGLFENRMECKTPNKNPRCLPWVAKCCSGKFLRCSSKDSALTSWQHSSCTRTNSGKCLGKSVTR